MKAMRAVNDLGLGKATVPAKMKDAVEPCPICGAVNRWSWSMEDGFKKRCQKCDAELMLCSMCLHAEDNPTEYCNWIVTTTGGKCWRGKTQC